MADNLDILREKLQQLHEDYHSLKNHFDMMSEGYQESLLLYDKLMETNQELEETNKQLDIARRRAEEVSQMKTNFIKLISHEIRTPLNILNGFTQILTTTGLDLDEETQEQVAFAVEDTGIGVPPEEAEHIFEEFVQLDDYYYGTGIGLTVARNIARRLGGDIVLDTTYTNGARFVFSLPK